MTLDSVGRMAIGGTAQRAFTKRVRVRGEPRAILFLIPVLEVVVGVFACSMTALDPVVSVGKHPIFDSPPRVTPCRGSLYKGLSRDGLASYDL